MTSARTRERMVVRLRERGIADERVLSALGRIPRHLFVDEALASRAYEETALPIGLGQTLSQPWEVARMTEALLAWEPERVLEVGAGSGYQSAVLGELVPEVWAVELEKPWSGAAGSCFRGSAIPTSTCGPGTVARSGAILPPSMPA